MISWERVFCKTTFR